MPNQLRVDNRYVSIKYKSPIVRGADIQKVQNLGHYAQILGGIAGGESVVGSLKVSDVPAWLADKLEVDASLVKSPLEIQQMLNMAVQASLPQDPAANANPQAQSGQEALMQEAQQGGMPNG